MLTILTHLPLKALCCRPGQQRVRQLQEEFEEGEGWFDLGKEYVSMVPRQTFKF